MRVLVLGAGVIGTTVAWYLADRGHEVTVLERREGPGLETSFANGGQISACHAEPWANPAAPMKILRWLGREDAPLLFRLRMDPAQWAWGLRFLTECRASRTRANTADIARLALYSRAQLRELRSATGIEYDAATRGILHFHTEEREFEAAVKSVDQARSLGLDRDVKTVDEAIAIEPALASARGMLVGATYTPSDESGDAHKFTVALAKLAAAKGVTFRYGQALQRLEAAGDRINAAVTASGPLAADAYVVALGSYSPFITRSVGIDIPVYPAKGYSITVAVTDPSRAPTVSLTDDAAKLVISRLGERLRIAGTAELSGYSTELNPARCDAIRARARALFPGVGDYAAATAWAGLRPATPSNVPLVGATRYPNLFLDTGHGTLGWTLACGSGAALADIISGRKPDIELRPPFPA
jgi:D-amino-acid dehydrogenase